MGENFKHATTQYVIRVWAGEYELSTFLTSARIVNSIRNCWPIVYLNFQIDDQEIIENNLYGQEHYKLKIYLTAENGDLLDEKNWELVYLESNLPLPSKPMMNVGQYEDVQRRQVVVVCIPKPSYIIMTSFINKLWEEEAVMVPLDFVKEVLEIKGYLADAIIRDDGFNEMFVNQLIIPPMTIKSMVDYINEKFGIYSGPMFRYCHFGGHFLMWDLKKTYEEQKASPRYIIYHKLPGKADEGLIDEIMDKCSDGTGTHYCGYEAAETLHHANSNIIQYGFKNIYVYHPHEDLYYLMQKEVPEIVTDFGIWHDNESIKYNEELNSRKMYFTDSRGFDIAGEYSPNIVTNRMAHHIKDAAVIRFLVKRNINIDNVMKIGEVCYYETYQENEMFEGADYTGGYLIETSDLTFSKEQDSGGGDNYDSSCLITGIRTVQTKV